MPDSPLDPETVDDTEAGRHRPSPPPVPRWVKVFGITFVVLAMVIVTALITGLGGPHSPSRHLAGLIGHDVPASATEVMHQP